MWKNTEDEILKVAVMKYGKNQWARISSLLVRKTPKQCKARWYEWLDPSIRKTEWSKEEDEKLLHLAKVMPTQWRSIAPLIGRTTTQCLERYQKLLDDAERADEAGGSDNDNNAEGGAPTADQVRRLRPGEVDPDPESKPARPDAIDMDEDEKEMLSEARARLANTQGKKAKRKARERQLDEARRLAAIQKRRELKAAGIDVHKKTKRKAGDLDYNAEIPYEHRVPLGIFDTSDEKRRYVDPKHVAGQLLQKFESKTRTQREEEWRRKESARRAKQAEEGREDTIANARLEKLAAENAVSKRVRLTLPAPQIGDVEMAEIVKQGAAAEEARDLVDTDSAAASQQLLGDQYTPAAQSQRFMQNLRTPRISGEQDSVMQSARDLITLTRNETPLLGGENTPLNTERLGDSATPRHQVAQTPNPLLRAAQLNRASAANNHGGSAITETPLGSLGGRTPRDSLNINTPGGFSTITATPQEARLQLSETRQLLDEAFASMPKPKNDFEIIAPEINDMNDDNDAGNASRGKSELIEDGADRAERLAKATALQNALKEAQLSQVVKRGLPRAVVMQVEAPPNSGLQALDLINAEMALLITNENCNDPPQGGPPVALEQEMPLIDPVHMNAAKALLTEEIAAVQLENGWTNRSALSSAYTELAENLEANLVFVKKTGKSVEAQQVDPKDLAADLRTDYETLKKSLLAVAGKSQRLQKKVGILLGGHMSRNANLCRQIETLKSQYADAEIENLAFVMRHNAEQSSLPGRLARLQEEVDAARRAQVAAQHRYRDIVERKKNPNSINQN